MFRDTAPAGQRGREQNVRAFLGGAASLGHVGDHRSGLGVQVVVGRSHHIVRCHRGQPIDVLLGVFVVSHRLEEAERHCHGLDGLVFQEVPGLESSYALHHLVHADRRTLQPMNFPEQSLDDLGRRCPARPDRMHGDNAYVPVRNDRRADVGHET